MQHIKTVFLTFFFSALSGLAMADDHGSAMPKPIPVEFWLCEYNEGKNASDLQPVIKEWKKTMGKRNYQSWMLTPTYASNGALNNSVMFTGWWDNFSVMGKEVDYTMANVDPKMNPKWSEVITCDTHAEAFAIQTRNEMDTSLENGVMSYRQCAYKEGKGSTDLMKAIAEWNKFLTKAGVGKSSSAVIFPGVGAPDSFHYTETIWAPDMSTWGNNVDKLIDAGANTVSQKLFGNIRDCGNGTRFIGQRIY